MDYIYIYIIYIYIYTIQPDTGSCWVFLFSGHRNADDEPY